MGVVFCVMAAQQALQVILMEEFAETYLSRQSTVNDDPGDEGVARDGGSRPYHSVPGDPRASHEPLVTNADLVIILAPKSPVAGAKTTRFKNVFDGANLFPGPAAVVGRIIIPPTLVSYVAAMDPFHPQRIFLCCDGPY